LIVFLLIIIGSFSIIVVVWNLVLRYQRERKISELKITYLRLFGEEENAYQRYIMAEKSMQTIEMDMEKAKEIIIELKSRIITRRKELRELIQQLRIVKSKLNLTDSRNSNLDLEVDSTKLTSEIKTRLVLNNEDKKRVISERKKIEERMVDLPLITREVEQLGSIWESLRREVEQVESEFRQVDGEAFKRFSEAFIKKKTEESKLDPERELINLLLLLNNKRGLLYVRKKEAAKDPTTESADLIKKYESDVKKLELQLVSKSRRFGISAKRLEELKNLFLK
jgi:hypothetical protein